MPYLISSDFHRMFTSDTVYWLDDDGIIPTVLFEVHYRFCTVYYSTTTVVVHSLHW